jgi:serine/threonine protein kinase
LAAWDKKSGKDGKPPTNKRQTPLSLTAGGILMPLFHSLSSLVLKGAALGAGEILGVKALGEGTDAVVGLLARRFSDHSKKLSRALEQANDRAWKALEICLAGNSWWERCKVTLASAEEKGLRQQVQAFLEAAPLGGLRCHGEEFRRECLRQLQAARKAGVLTAGSLDPQHLAADAGAFARHGDPAAVLDTEWRAVEQMAAEVRAAGYPALADFLALQPPQGPPLLVAAARYFFARMVESDRELFQGVAFARLEDLTRGQEAGFAALGDALDQYARKLEDLLGDVHSVVVETRADVLDVKAELQRQGRQMQELGQAVLQALQQHQLERRALNPGDSLSVRGDGERQLVRALVKRYRALPVADREAMPALLNAIGKLEVVAGEFEAAQRDFQQVAGLVPDAQARAEVCANAYQAALERRNWPEALEALKQAAALDPERFAPFPLAKFEPERILGAGGFGVAFLCRNRHSGSRVVIKTLRGDNLDRDLNEVFAEAQVLEELEHPAIIRLRDCDYADAGRTRPYLVMDYFPGQTLADYVTHQGPLAAADLLPLARLVAEGLRTAHSKNILHRDVKPANLLVRREGGEWQAKLIDFGLALRGTTLQSTARSQADRTLAGNSIAGTLDYAAPEQMGKLPGVPVAPYSDVYGFGKTCCYALFKTPQPTFQHWQKLPAPLAELLGRCLHETPTVRPHDFDGIVQRLERLEVTLGSKQPAAVVVLEAQPVEEVLPIVEEVRPARRPEAGRGRPRPEAIREEPPPHHRPRRLHRLEEEPAAPGSLWPWLVVVVVVCVVGIALLAYFHIRGPGGGGGPPGVQAPKTPGFPFAGPAPEPPAEPVKDEEFPKVLEELKKAAPAAGRQIARRLAATPPRQPGPGVPGTERYRQDVSRALNPLLTQDKPAKIAAAEALAHWGTKENVLALVDRLTLDDGDVRKPAIQALVRIKAPRGLAAVADRLEDIWDRQQSGVANALKSAGPAAEEAVIPHLKSKDHFGRREAAQILAAIGTEKSLPALEEVRNDKDHFFHNDVETAIKAIRTRLDVTKGDEPEKKDHKDGKK